MGAEASCDDANEEVGARLSHRRVIQVQEKSKRSPMSPMLEVIHGKSIATRKILGAGNASGSGGTGVLVVVLAVLVRVVLCSIGVACSWK